MAGMRSAAVRAYFRTPKGGLVLVLLALLAIAYPVDGRAALLRVVLGASVAMAGDLLLMRFRGKWELPDSAFLTGVIVAMVMSQRAPWYAIVAATALAIVSKHLLRTKHGHIFNPAAVGLLLTALFLSSEQSWWGGLGDTAPLLIVFVIAGGAIIAERTNKWASVLAFGATYFGLLTALSLAGSGAGVADAFREPMSGAALFFAFFMLTDPPTSPARPRDQVWFAMLVAGGSVACLALAPGAVYYLLAGLLLGNAVEGARRAIGSRKRRPAPAPARPAQPAYRSIALG
ncbi:MAG TPA: RnfABCDGE type electron transport complex subunit D [Chloroflexota bacterium]|nr:RnfABCDGE type electron transport complex subunit D [Chloroflexota bacterium]